MGIASTDPNTGKPTYNDISHTQTDLQAAVDFAEKGLGEHVATVGALPANGGLVGRRIWVDVDSCYYTWTGSTWMALQQTIGLVASGGSLGTGFTAGTGAQVPRLTRQGNVRILFGTVVFGGGSNYSSTLTLASADQPATTTARSLGMAMIQPSTGSGVVAEAFLTGGVLSLGVATASVPAGTVHLAGLTWVRD